MLEKLLIQNFQCHRRRKLIFDSAVTTLTGESDAGKSAILRSLQFLCLNRPSGDAFIKHGQTVCRILLQVDGRTIHRAKGNRRNTYQINDRVYRSFKSTPPDDVANILNVDAGNFQLQHEPPFLLSQSPSQIAQYLNRVIALDLIDRSLSHIGKQVRKAKTVVEVTRTRLQEAKTRVKSLVWVVQADRELREVEEKGEKLEEIRETRAKIADLLGEGESVGERQDRAFKALLYAEKAVAAGERMREVGEKVNSLVGLIENLEKTQENRRLKGLEAKRLEKELRERNGGFCPLCGNRTIPRREAG